jgi:hypothetical protein
VLGEHVDHGAGESDRTAAGACLGRPNLQLAGHLGHDLGDLDGAAQRVDALASEARQLADAQPAVGADQDQSAVPRPDDVSEPGDLDRGEEAHLLPLDLGERDRRQGDWAIMPASTAPASTLPSRW